MYYVLTLDPEAGSKDKGAGKNPHLASSEENA